MPKLVYGFAFGKSLCILPPPKFRNNSALRAEGTNGRLFKPAIAGVFNEAQSVVSKAKQRDNAKLNPAPF